MGATRGVHVTDPALAGSCAVSTATVLAAALEALEFDLVLAGVDTSDGVGGTVPAAVAAHLGLPFLSYAARIEPDEAAAHGPRPADQPDRATTCSRRRCRPLISCTQALGEPRYPSLKGIMAARSKEIVTRSLADLELDPAAVGGAVATTTVLDTSVPPERGATEVVRGTAEDGAARIVEFLAAAAGSSDGRAVGDRGARTGRRRWPASARRSRRSRASSVQPAAGRSSGSSSPPIPGPAADELARYVPRVLAIAEPATADRAWSAIAAAARRRPARRTPARHRPTRSSWARVRTAGTWPARCPR